MVQKMAFLNKGYRHVQCLDRRGSHLVQCTLFILTLIIVTSPFCTNVPVLCLKLVSLQQKLSLMSNYLGINTVILKRADPIWSACLNFCPSVRSLIFVKAINNISHKFECGFSQLTVPRQKPQ